MNNRAWILWGLREPALAGELHLPWEPEADDSNLRASASKMLSDEMAVVKWNQSAAGKIQIERKPEVKNRLGRSPDVADSVALALMPLKVTADCEPLVAS